MLKASRFHHTLCFLGNVCFPVLWMVPRLESKEQWARQVGPAQKSSKTASRATWPSTYQQAIVMIMCLYYMMATHPMSHSTLSSGPNSATLFSLYSPTLQPYNTASWCQHIRSIRHSLECRMSQVHARLRKTVTRYDVCRLACKMYTTSISPTNDLLAFRESGVHPFNPDAIDQTLLAPSITFVRPHSSSEPEPVPPQHVPTTTTEQFFLKKKPTSKHCLHH